LVQLVVGDQRGHLDQRVALSDRPVISQSIQTIRSARARSPPEEPAVGEEVGVVDALVLMLTAPG
jgi:hypothetical protein